MIKCLFFSCYHLSQPIIDLQSSYQQPSQQKRKEDDEMKHDIISTTRRKERWLDENYSSQLKNSSLEHGLVGEMIVEMIDCFISFLPIYLTIPSLKKLINRIEKVQCKKKISISHKIYHGFEMGLLDGSYFHYLISQLILSDNLPSHLS